MDRYDFSLKLERAFVEYVDGRADEKGLGKGEFAHQVWPEDTLKAAASRWSDMRSMNSVAWCPAAAPERAACWEVAANAHIPGQQRR